MRHPLKGLLAVLATVATSLGLLGGVASLADQDRDTRAFTLLAESMVAAALPSRIGAR